MADIALLPSGDGELDYLVFSSPDRAMIQNHTTRTYQPPDTIRHECDYRDSPFAQERREFFFYDTGDSTSSAVRHSHTT